MIDTCTIDELVRMLLAIRGARAITFTARTDAEVRAKDAARNPNPFPRPIWKTATINAMVNFWYDRGIYRRLKAEGKSPNAFRQGASWHDPLTIGKRLTPLCQSKTGDKLYLRVMRMSVLGDLVYHDSKGTRLTLPQVAPFLKPRNDYRNQGLSNPLEFKTYALESIQAIKFEGQSFRIT